MRGMDEGNLLEDAASYDVPQPSVRLYVAFLDPAPDRPAPGGVDRWSATVASRAGVHARSKAGSSERKNLSDTQDHASPRSRIPLVGTAARSALQGSMSSSSPGLRETPASTLTTNSRPSTFLTVSPGTPLSVAAASVKSVIRPHSRRGVLAAR